MFSRVSFMNLTLYLLQAKQPTNPIPTQSTRYSDRLVNSA